MTEPADRLQRGMNESLQKGLAVLAAVAERGPAKLAELAAETGIDYTTTYRMISTLNALGYVERDPLTKRYEVGPAVLRLGYGYLKNLQLSQVAAPVMREVRDALRETVNLSILDGQEMVLVDALQGPQLLNTRIRIGGRYALHCSASGKVALANLPPEEAERLLATIPLVAYSPRTITDRAVLARAVRLVRERGFAINDEEMAIGLKAVAAPILDHQGTCVGVLDVPIPSVRADASFLEERVVPVVVSAAAQVTRAMGGQSNGSG
jgi:DNA-binding IclR family transcriptional regulator